MSKNINACLSHSSDEWETPQDLFDKLNNIFHFDCDFYANENNHKCDYYFTKEKPFKDIDDLWCVTNVFMNPPYSKVKDACEMATYLMSIKRNVVMLIPSRTDTAYFHNFIYEKPNVSILFIRGRIKFCINGVPQKSAPFPSMLVFFRGN